MRNMSIAAAFAATIIAGGCATTTPVDTQQMAVQAAQDAQVAAVARTANTGEVQQGEVARDRATNAEVRQFATMMVEDHTRANQELETLASTRGIAFAEGAATDTLRRNAETSVSNLRQYSGVELDRAYIRHQVELHQYLLNVIDQNLLPATSDAEMRTYLQTMRGSVATHLEQARQISGRL